MRKIYLLVLCCFLFAAGFAQNNDTAPVDPNKLLLTVEAACGQCMLGLPGASCDLAVRVDGKSYLVDGTSIDQPGDAHADDGFCNAVRKANVQGKIVDGRFKASYFKILPYVKKE